MSGKISAHLIHFLQLGTDCRETSHELFQSDFTKIVVLLLGAISLLCNELHVLRSLQVLGFSFTVFVENSEIGSGFRDILLELSNLGSQQVLIDGLQLF